MNVLLTGARGFIGSRAAQHLVDRGHQVHALLRPSSACPALEDGPGSFTAWPADLHDPAAVKAAIEGTAPDTALHLAWYTAPGRYLHDRPANLESLAAGVALLGQLIAGGCSRIVLGGTCLEGATDSPPTFYAVTKRALHGVASELTNEHMSIACCHIFSVYGPGEDERRAVPSVIRSLLRGDPVAVSDAAESRDFLHVDDVAEALATVLESDAVGTIDICSGNPRPLRAVFETIGEATGRGDLIGWGQREHPPGEDYHVAGEATRLGELGWAPSRSLEDGIAETVAWWRARLTPTLTAAEAL